MEGEDEENASVGKNCKDFMGNHWKGVLILLIPVLFLPILFFLGTTNDMRCLYVVCLMAFYWITEAVPLYVTSLFPILFMPLLGILDSDVVCIQYWKDPLVMFFGGLIVALSIEYCDFHKRVALKVILVVGCSPRRLHAGLLFTSVFISMWINNAATTAMMCPIIKALLEELHSQNVINIYEESEEGDDEHNPSLIAQSYYLSVAYGATVGGNATLIATATNLVFKGIYDGRFPNSEEKMDFPIFMAYCAPLVWLLAIALFFSMEFTHMGLFRKNSKEAIALKTAGENKEIVETVIKERYVQLGGVTSHELQVVFLFALMVALLFFRHPGFMYGWADFFDTKPIKSSTPVVLCVLLLFTLPINYTFFKFCCGKGPFPDKSIPSLISWKYLTKNMPWGLVFLLGGGFAVATGSVESGMAKRLGESMSAMEVLPLPLLQFLCIDLGVFMTAFSSNVAIANIIIPILCELSLSIKVHPLYLVLPAGLGCNMAFLLPVSTPCNAIVCGYANIKTKSMAFAGILPTVWSIVLLFLTGQTWQYVIYPKSTEFPEWAEAKD